MADDLTTPAVPDVHCDGLFTDRWSPRAFRREPLAESDVAALFEAARWAPSSYNEQPWLFVYGTAAEDRARILGLLVEQNRVWCERAPLLVILFTRKTFVRNGKPNRHAQFDAGSAWLSLALQARRLGLHAHAMAGFDHVKANDVLGVPADDWEAMAAIAVGRRDQPGVLPEPLAAREQRSPRRALSSMAMAGRFESGSR